MQTAIKLLVALMSWMVVTTGSAQSTGTPTRPSVASETPMLIALGTEAAAPYQLLVHPHGGVREIIVLPPSATEENLSAAVRAAMLSRLHAGPSREPILVRVLSTETTSPCPLSWATQILDDLRRAPIQVVEGVGRVRAIRISFSGQLD